MFKRQPPASPHVAVAGTVAIAILGAAVLALDPTPARSDATLAAMSLRPSCAAAGRGRTAPSGRPLQGPASPGSSPELAAVHEGPQT